jgi:SAM-dependent methyltransferase
VKIKKIIKEALMPLSLRFLSDRLSSGFAWYLDRYVSGKYGTPERVFIADNGRKIPVYSDYRYSVKLGWSYFKGLHVLSNLITRGEASSDESSFFTRAIGRRTLEVSLKEINDVAIKAIRRNKKLFLNNSEDADGLSEFLPVEKDIKKAIDSFRRGHATMFRNLAAAGVYKVPPDASILEIGYISGGHSIQDFDLLGYRASGIDNNYSGLVNRNFLHQHISDLTGSKASFLHGDITSQTELSSNSFDVIFSASVLEHISDVTGAFAEMYRLLKPGGIVIHNYAPYFSHDGGHALGIGDSPWAHVRLNEEEYLRYLNELRPHEASVAADWMRGAMNRNMPQWRMQRVVAMAGFRIALWTAKTSPRKFTANLSPQIIRECYENTPDIGIQDLISQSVSFVALK